MAITTKTMTTPHPTIDHVVGQWMNKRQDMILAMPLILTMPTTSFHHPPSTVYATSAGQRSWYEAIVLPLALIHSAA